jgi:hypothetical protein
MWPPPGTIQPSATAANQFTLVFSTRFSLARYISLPRLDDGVGETLAGFGREFDGDLAFLAGREVGGLVEPEDVALAEAGDQVVGVLRIEEREGVAACEMGKVFDS